MFLAVTVILEHGEGLGEELDIILLEPLAE